MSGIILENIHLQKKGSKRAEISKTKKAPIELGVPPGCPISRVLSAVFEYQYIPVLLLFFSLFLFFSFPPKSIIALTDRNGMYYFQGQMNIAYARVCRTNIRHET